MSSQEQETAMCDQPDDKFSTGEHQKVKHHGLFVCDTCTNILGLNIRWDQAPCQKLPVVGTRGGDRDE